MPIDVLIIGAGPAGLAAAIEAASAGFSVTVADATHPPLLKACGEGLFPSGVDALARLGITLPPATTAPFYGIRFLQAANTAEAHFPGAPARGVSRAVLSQLLLSRAQTLGVQFLWRTTLRSLTLSAASATAHFDSPESPATSLTPRWLIGADGLHSTVRRLAGLDRVKVSSRRFGLRQHFRTRLGPTHVEVHWGSDSQAYVTPTAPGEINLAIVCRSRPASFADALHSFPSLHAVLEDATAIGPVRGAATWHARVARITRGPVALLGDAAGSVDALTGEGVALAFDHAAALVHAICRNDLHLYVRDHRRLSRLPRIMSRALLLLDRHPSLRNRTIRAFARYPALFQTLLHVHLGHHPRWPFRWPQHPTPWVHHFHPQERPSHGVRHSELPPAG